MSDLKNCKILCVGDVMLDRFVYGGVDRISPESPVPILHTQRDFMVVGGAGNVARNIAALEGNVIFISVVGDDIAGQTINQLLQEEKAITPHLLKEKGRQTTAKTRFIAQGQQLLRVDEEVIKNCDSQTEEQIIKVITENIDQVCAVVLSDYGKGVLSAHLCQAIIQLCKSKNIQVVVDPKGKNYERYFGATIITPNLKELKDITHYAINSNEDVLEAAKYLQDVHQFDHVLITKGAQGMTILLDADQAIHIPAEAREVYDVSGAGDTVVATLAMALASGQTLERACRLANCAAGIVVGKVGTAVVSRLELENAYNPHNINTHNKIVTLSQLLDLVKEWRRLGLKIGFTNGCFDLLHQGHLHILRGAAEACDRLIVGLNTDASVQRLKGPTRPLHDEETRAEVLASLSMVDAIALFDDETPRALIEAILPDVLVKGADYTVDKVVGADVVQARGGRVVLVDLKPGHSTTKTVNKIN